MGVVPPAESNLAVLEVEQTMVGDGDAMGVTGQVVQDIFGTRQRAAWYRQPNPDGTGNEPERGTTWDCEAPFGLRKIPVSLPGKPAGGRPQTSPKHAAEDLHRQEEGVAGMNPAGVIGRQTARRNHAVDMAVVLQVLSPSVEHA